MAGDGFHDLADAGTVLQSSVTTSIYHSISELYTISTHSKAAVSVRRRDGPR